jgi:hypothetical protein
MTRSPGPRIRPGEVVRAVADELESAGVQVLDVRSCSRVGLLLLSGELVVWHCSTQARRGGPGRPVPDVTPHHPVVNGWGKRLRKARSWGATHISRQPGCVRSTEMLDKSTPPPGSRGDVRPGQGSKSAPSAIRTRDLLLRR